MIKNCLLVVLCTALTLGLAELALSNFTGLGKFEYKIEVHTSEQGCYGNCYTSNPRGYFPITYRVASKYVFPDAAAGDPGDVTLYCLAYACQDRKRGFFPERREEVFLVGDSFTFGEGVKNEDTLGYLLGLKFTRYNFRNFGETAADLKRVYQIEQDLFNEHRENGIKHLIYFYNLNDVAMSQEVARRQKYIIDFQNLRWSNVSGTDNPVMRFLSRLALYRLGVKAVVLHRESVLTVKNYLDMYFGSSNARQMQESMDMLVSMNTLARQKEAKLTIVLYPLLYKDPAGKYPFLAIHDLIMGVCTQNGIMCIDAYGAFKDQRSLAGFTVHPVDFHPNGLANRAVVDYLEGKL